MYTGNELPARSFEIRPPPHTPPFHRFEVLTDYSQFKEGLGRLVEEMLDEQPMVTNIRGPPSLVGQLIRCVLVFHSGPRNATI